MVTCRARRGATASRSAPGARAQRHRRSCTTSATASRAGPSATASRWESSATNFRLSHRAGERRRPTSSRTVGARGSQLALVHAPQYTHTRVARGSRRRGAQDLPCVCVCSARRAHAARGRRHAAHRAARARARTRVQPRRRHAPRAPRATAAGYPLLKRCAVAAAAARARALPPRHRPSGPPRAPRRRRARRPQPFARVRATSRVVIDLDVHQVRRHCTRSSRVDRPMLTESQSHAAPTSRSRRPHPTSTSRCPTASATMSTSRRSSATCSAALAARVAPQLVIYDAGARRPRDERAGRFDGRVALAARAPSAQVRAPTSACPSRACRRRLRRDRAARARRQTAEASACGAATMGRDRKLRRALRYAETQAAAQVRRAAGRAVRAKSIFAYPARARPSGAGAARPPGAARPHARAPPARACP